MMTADHVQLLQESWKAVLPIADKAAQLFYLRLFEIAPEVKPLFANTDMATQGGKLVQTIGTAIDHVDQIELLRPILEQLGRRHVGYGVADHHYDQVGAALLWTLELGLGDRFDQKTRAAWTVAYSLISGVMRQAANDTPCVASMVDGEPQQVIAGVRQ